MFTAGNDLEDFLKAGTATSDAPRKSNAIKFLYALAHNAKPLVAAVDGIAVGIGTTMLFHCDYVVATKAATFATPFIHLGLVPEGASSLLMPRTMGHQRAFSTLVMGRRVNGRGCRASPVSSTRWWLPDETEATARKVAREICALPAEAVAISRKLLRPSPEDLTRRIDQESHLFGERMRSRRSGRRVQGVLRAQEGVRTRSLRQSRSAAVRLREAIQLHCRTMDRFRASLLLAKKAMRMLSAILAPLLARLRRRVGANRAGRIAHSRHQ